MLFVPTPAFSKPAAGQAPRWDDAQQRYVAASDPVLGTAAYKNVGTGASDVAAGNAPTVAAAAAVVTAEAYADAVGAAAVVTAGAHADSVAAAAQSAAETYADGAAAAAEAAAEAYAAGLVAALGARVKVFVSTGMDFTTTHVDAGSFTGLPAKYLVRSLGFYDMSTVPGGAASTGLRTAASGGGTDLGGSSIDGALSSAVKTSVRQYTDFGGQTLSYRTESTLYVYMNAGNGVALTGSAFLEIIDLT